MNRQLKHVSLDLHAPQLSFYHVTPLSHALSPSIVDAHPLVGGSTHTPAEQALPVKSNEHFVKV